MASFYITKKNQWTYLYETDEYDRITYFVPMSEKRHTLVATIYVGQVKDIHKGIQAAFVDIGQEVNGFLPLSKGQKPPRPGSNILVQVAKEATHNKGPRLTQDIAISGHYGVVLTDSQRIHYSRKLEESVKTALDPVLNKRLTSKYGYLIRTKAKDVSPTFLVKELEKQVHQLEEILTKWPFIKGPACIYQPFHPVIQALEKIPANRIEGITINDLVLYDLVKGYYQEVGSSLTKVISLTEAPVYSKHKIDRFIDKALRKKVWLKEGISLVIEETEACVVIDVNTDKYKGKKTAEKTIHKVNMLAAKEIARQIQFRNLSGIIIIDFIDMVKDQAKTELVNYMINLLKMDPQTSKVYGLTHLGLLEMTRKREGYPLSSLFNKTR